eukprot:3499115-Ditylum_brightwellii.AAC.1
MGMDRAGVAVVGAGGRGDSPGCGAKLSNLVYTSCSIWQRQGQLWAAVSHPQRLALTSWPHLLTYT